jgi:hypothetical protein
MATFSEQQVTSLAVILGTNSNELAAHLDYHASIITTTDKTAVLVEVDKYDCVSDDFVSIHPMEANKGLETSGQAARRGIASKIAGLLHWTLTNSYGTARLYRS